MTKEEHQQIINYCDNLTASGKSLTVSWDGGGDSGIVEIILDDEVQSQDPNVERLIEDCVLGHLGYESFDGSWSASGEVSYNREDKCFEGSDSYSQSESGVAKFEALKFLIPEDIWFDELRIQFDKDDEDESLSSISVQFIIENGPHTDVHTALEETIKSAISERVEYEIQNINDLDQVRYDEMFSRIDLDPVEKGLQFSFSQFDYSYEDIRGTDVTIFLTDQLEIYESL